MHRASSMHRRQWSPVVSRLHAATRRLWERGRAALVRHLSKAGANGASRVPSPLGDWILIDGAVGCPPLLLLLVTTMRCRAMIAMSLAKAALVGSSPRAA